MDIKAFIWVAAGGALGSMGRYALTVLASLLFIRPEWATFVANVCGSFLIGLALPSARSECQLFYTVGLCGGFTTFSTFSSQSMRLFQDGQYLLGLTYILATTVVSLTMVALGWYCHQKLWG